MRLLLSVVGGAESMMLSACTESMIVSAPPAESMILSALFDHDITLIVAWWGATKQTTIGKTDNHQLTIGQQCLNGGANRSAAKGGQVLPHFQQIVSGASMLPCPIATVIKIFCKRLLVVGHWSLVIGCWLLSLVVGRWSVGRSTIRVSGLWEVSLQHD
jgi:hypothetical protein